MNVVDTPSPKKDRFVLRPDGTIDFDAYIGLDASFPVGKINVTVRIVGARTRYGHLDLNITPVTGTGTRWIEYKNLIIHEDPFLIKSRVSVFESNETVAETSRYTYPSYALPGLKVSELL